MKKISNVIILVLLVLSMAAVAQSAYFDSPQVNAALLTQNPDPARAGDKVDVRIKLQNVGGETSTQVVGEILPEFPFTLVSGQSAQQVIGEIPNYPTEANFKILTYTLLVSRDAIDRTYDLKFRYSDNGGTSWTIETFSITVTSTEFAQIIHLDKSKLNPGEETPMTFTINNIGKAPLTNLIFTWNEENNVILPVNTDNTRYISYLGVGESIDLVYTVVANPSAERGLYNLDLKLTFDATNSTSGGVQSTGIETNAGVLVGGSTDFDIAFSESSNDQTSFTIANIGSNPASSVSVIIPQQDSWKVTGANSMIIGNLNTGDYTIASFSLKSVQTGPQTIAQKDQQKNASTQELSTQGENTQTQDTLKIQVAYTDTTGTRQLVEKEVAVNQQSLMAGNNTSLPTQTSSFGGRSQQSFFSKSKWYVIALVALAVIGASYWKYRKEKLLNPDFKIKDLFKRKGILAKKRK